MNIKVQCNKVNGSREKNVKPKITPDVLSKGKIEELGVKTSLQLSKLEMIH